VQNTRRSGILGDVFSGGRNNWERSK